MRFKPLGLICLILLLAGCLPTPAAEPTPASTPGSVQLPPTWTIQATSNPAPTQTQLEEPTPSSTPAVLPTSLTAASPVPFLGIKAFDPLQVWAWDQERIWRSEDGGQTWEEITPNQSAAFSVWSSTILDRFTAIVGFCSPSADHCGLIRTLDGGQNWEVINDSIDLSRSLVTFSDLDHGVFQPISMDAAAGSSFLSFFETKDGGRTWERVILENPTEFMSLMKFHEIRICNCGDSLTVVPGRVIHIPGNLVRDPWSVFNVWISQDRGRKWSIARLPLPPGNFNPGMIDPFQPVFYDDQEAVLPVRVFPEMEWGNFTMLFYSTQDGGRSWTFRSLVENAGNMHFDHRFLVASPQDYYFICGNDLCASHDGVLTWERIPTALNWNDWDIPTMVTSLVFGDGTVGWALSSDQDHNHSLWKTEDGGHNWTALDPVFLP